MATRLTPFGQFVKWVVVPAALVVAGYFLIGPRLGKTSEPPASSTQEVQSPPPQGAETQPAGNAAAGNDERSKPKFAEPEVRVSVQPAGSSPTNESTSNAAASAASTDPSATPAKPHRRRRRRKHIDVPQGDAQDADGPAQKTPPTVPPPDQGGSGGATTAGDTTG